MNFTKLTDNVLKLLDRYVYGPMGRGMDRVCHVLFSDKFVKLVAAPSLFAMFALLFYSLFAMAKYENDNPCLEWVETEEQVCSTHCVNAGQYSQPICNTRCRPKKECTVRQMADGTVQTH